MAAALLDAILLRNQQRIALLNGQVVALDHHSSVALAPVQQEVEERVGVDEIDETFLTRHELRRLRVQQALSIEASLAAAPKPRTGAERSKQLNSLRRRFETRVQHQAPRFGDNGVLIRPSGPKPKWLQHQQDGEEEAQQQAGAETLPDAASPAATQRRPGLTFKGRRLTTEQQELQGHLQAVLDEAGLTPGAVQSLLSAAVRDVITNNPGLLLCQVLRIVSGLQAVGLSRQQVMVALEAYPALCNTSAETMAWNLEELCGMFGKQPVTAMVLKRPGLLCASPFSVWSRLLSLASLLGTAVDKAQALVVRQPRLLLTSPAALASRLHDLQEMTGLDERSLRRLVLRQPAVLTYHASTLVHNLDSMANHLQLPLPKVAQMLSKSPTLLMLHPETLSHKLQGLAEVLQCDLRSAVGVVARQPSILPLSRGLLEAKCLHITEELHLPSTQHAQQLALTRPELLTLAPGTLGRKLASLHDALDRAGQGATDPEPAPTPPSATSSSTSTSTSALAASVAVPTQAADALQPAQQVPAAQPPDQVAACGSSSSSSAGGAPQESVALAVAQAWREQLESSSPSVLATYMCFSEQRYERLLPLCRAVVKQRAQRTQADRAGASAADAQLQKQKQRLPAVPSLSGVLRSSDHDFALLLKRFDVAPPTGGGA